MFETSLRKGMRLLAMLFAVSIIAAACGSDDTVEASDDTTTTTAAEAEDTTTTTAAEAEDTTTTTSADEGGDTEPESAFPDLEGRTVSVGVENAYLPFNYIPVGGDEGEGWDYDAWNEICRLLNCEAEFVAAGWPDVIDQVAQGDLDTAADGISITDERKEIVDFSIPYMTVQQKFIVGLDDDRYATADDIINGDAIVATQVGTTNFELAQDLLGGTDRIQAFDQFGLAIQALIAGDVDAVIIDDAAGLGYIGENADQVKTIDDGLQSDPLGFIYPQGSDLVEPVNAAIEEMKTSGFLDQIGAKFFGTEFTVTYDDIAEVDLG